MSQRVTFSYGLSGGGSGDRPPSVPFSASIIISDSDDAAEPSVPFSRDEWIACDKQWVDPMPKEVIQARNAARAIPDGILTQLIPEASMTVSELLSTQISPSISATEGISYNTDKPNVFVTNTLPSSQLLTCRFKSSLFAVT